MGFVLSFAISVLGTPFSDGEEPGSHFLNLFTYLLNPSIPKAASELFTMLLWKNIKKKDSLPIRVQ